MNWIKRKICAWLGVERYDDWGEAVAIDDGPRVSRHHSASNFFDRNPEQNFKLYKANGGIILEVANWDKTRNEWTTNMHILHDSSELTNEIAKIMTMEFMR